MDIQRKIHFAIIGSLFFALFLGVFAISPLLKEIKHSSEEILNLRSELASLSAKRQEQTNLQEKIRILGPELQKVKNLFIDLETPIVFLEFLEKTANQTNVLIEVSLLGTPSKGTEEADLFSSLRFYLTVAGSASDALRFLDKLETAPYLIEIEDLTMTGLTESQLKTKEYERFSFGAVELKFSIKVGASDSHP